jgi:hypothetical protein
LERDHEMDDCDLESNFENPYHNLVLGWEQCVWDWRHGEFGFKVELSNFLGILQAEGFIYWLHEVERILDHMNVKLVAIKLKCCAFAW